jgi:hypothetical protein
LTFLNWAEAGDGGVVCDVQLLLGSVRVRPYVTVSMVGHLRKPKRKETHLLPRIRIFLREKARKIVPVLLYDVSGLFREEQRVWVIAELGGLGWEFAHLAMVVQKTSALECPYIESRRRQRFCSWTK